MARVEQPSNGHGSLKDIQILVNKHPQLINKEIKAAFPGLTNHRIIWHSPLKNDNYAEYRDKDFIGKVGLNIDEIKISEFWPSKGPQWDALASTDKNVVILVEAKANIPEIVSPPTGAGNKSKTLIESSLNETKDYLGIKNDVNWTGKFYQFTNRLAHLYFLRHKNALNAYLINIYFIDDKSVEGPESEKEWEAALEVMYTYLGLKRHKLSKYMANIFIDVNNL